MTTSHLQTIAKAATWRVVGALDTFLLSYLVTGKVGAALGIIGLETITKTAVYYAHERMWTLDMLTNLFTSNGQGA
jgi:uncharacterized membrane protein